MNQTTTTNGADCALPMQTGPKRIALPTADSVVSWFTFELVDQDGRTVGGGRILAPGPASAKQSASMLLAGSCSVRVLGEVA